MTAVLQERTSQPDPRSFSIGVSVGAPQPPLPEYAPRLDPESEDRWLHSNEYVFGKAVERLQYNAARTGQTEPTDLQLRGLSIIAGRPTDQPLTVADLGNGLFDGRIDWGRENEPEPVLAVPVVNAEPDKISYFLQLVLEGAATGTTVRGYAGQAVRQHPRVVDMLERLRLKEEDVFFGGEDWGAAQFPVEDLQNQLAAHDPERTQSPVDLPPGALGPYLHRYLGDRYTSEDGKHVLPTSHLEQQISDRQIVLRTLAAQADYLALARGSSRDSSYDERLRHVIARIQNVQASITNLFTPVEARRKAIIAHQTARIAENQRLQEAALLEEDGKIATTISALCQDNSVHAIMPMLPGNTQQGDTLIRQSLNRSDKNIDGLNDNAHYGPITPDSMLKLAEYYANQPLEAVPPEEIAVIGNGLLVGKPIRDMLAARGIVPGIDLKSKEDVLGWRKAFRDRRVSLVFAMGRGAKFLHANELNPGVLDHTFIIDAGNAVPPGEQQSYGNVHPESLSAERSIWASPLIGGLGPATADNAIGRTQETASRQFLTNEKLLGSRRVAALWRKLGWIAGNRAGLESQETIAARRQAAAETIAHQIARRHLQLAA